MRTITVHGLPFRANYTRDYCETVCRNMAGLLTVMQDDAEDTVFFGPIIRAAVNHGLVTDKPREITAGGYEWLASYTGDIATRAEVTRRTVPRYGRAERAAKGIPPAVKPAPKPVAVARDLVAAGLLFIHPTVLDKLGPECFYLWAYSRTHRDLTTLDALAQAVHWSLSDTAIRAERCAERGYPLSLTQSEDAA